MMSEYQLTTSDVNGPVLRTADQAHIPNDPANRDWIEYQNWLAVGNVPDPYVPPPPSLPTPDANERITAGVLAATEVTKSVKADAPLDARVTALEASLKAMCEAQMTVIAEPAPHVE
jgi:hypothetical protein